MKLTEKHFDTFHKSCEKYLKKFGLDEWKPRYEFKKLEHSDARSLSNIEDHDCTICLSTEIGYGTFKETTTINEELDELAKHEVIHVMLGELANFGISKCYTESDCIMAEEALVRKLIKLL